MPPNQPLQRTRAAPRDRCYFTASLRAEPCFDLDGAPLNGNPFGGNHHAHHQMPACSRGTITRRPGLGPSEPATLTASLN
jgi:hypothetical protein